ncbi:MAG: hypothetical protein ACKVWV_16660 [Planctomycetota bacterium]
MYRVIVTTAAFVLASFERPTPKSESAIAFKDEAMVFEYVPATGEAVLVMSAESDASLSSVDIRGPHGASIMKLRCEGGRQLALSGYKVESEESDLAQLFDAYPEGVYRIRARAVDGRSVKGEAMLSYTLPLAAAMVYPLEGATDVPTSGLVIRWNADASAAAYQVSLEQDDNDGLTVQLPAGKQFFEVPDGFLASNTKTKIEIAVIGVNGNRTLVEVACATQ